MADLAFLATLVPNLVPNRTGNRLSSRRHRTGNAVEEVHPAPSLVRDPARVVPQRRRRVHVTELSLKYVIGALAARSSDAKVWRRP